GRRHVVRRGELPPVRVARVAHWGGGGGVRGARRFRRRTDAGACRPRVTRPGAERAARFHLSGAQGLPVRDLARTGDVRRDLGGGTGKAGAGGRGKGDGGHRELAPRAVSGSGDDPRAVRIVSPRCADRPHPPSPIPHHALLVVPPRDGPRTARRRAVEGGERALPEPGPGGPARGAALRAPRVR